MDMVGLTARGMAGNAISMVFFQFFGVRALLPLPEVARPKYFLMCVDYINNYQNSKLLDFHSMW